MYDSNVGKEMEETVDMTLQIYRWVMRFVVEILDGFPFRRIDIEEIELRKGRFQPQIPIPDGLIWVHGASLGEIITLRPFLRGLTRKVGRDRVLATATTMDGYRRILDDGIAGHASLFPLEIPEFLEPFLERIRPSLVLLSETEIWPLFLATLKSHGIPYGIINARVNEKTVRFMRLFRSLFREGLEGLSFVHAQEPTYARRFQFLGVPNEKIRVSGCFKFDLKNPALSAENLREKFRIPPGREVICFGSTHPGEEKIILDALEPLWGNVSATMVLAPRHVKRAGEVEGLLRERRLNFSRLSDRNSAPGSVILVDTLGELANLYAISSLAFVGGSLIPHGGHNLMEPAACGVPLVSGPHTSNFPLETQALEKAEALTTVTGSRDLRTVIEDFFRDPAPYRERGKRAAGVLDAMSGASERTIGFLESSGFL